MARRIRTAHRRRQIAEAAVRLTAKHGLGGVRVARIADEIGITDAALYRHFRSKEDILIAAYDLLAERVFRWLETLPGANPTQRLEHLGKTHENLFSLDIDGFNMPMFQFNVWIPRDRLRAHVDCTHLAMMEALARLVEEGKAEGCFRPEADVDVVVSELYAWIWWEDLSHLRGISSEIIAKGSREMFGRILSELRIAD